MRLGARSKRGSPETCAMQRISSLILSETRGQRVDVSDLRLNGCGQAGLHYPYQVLGLNKVWIPARDSNPSIAGFRVLDCGQSLPGAKVRTPSKIAPEASLRIVRHGFVPSRRDSSFPAPLPPPFSPPANLSPRNLSCENPQYLRASSLGV